MQKLPLGIWKKICTASVLRDSHFYETFDKPNALGMFKKK